jgi:hypothetical protein
MGPGHAGRGADGCCEKKKTSGRLDSRQVCLTMLSLDSREAPGTCSGVPGVLSLDMQMSQARLRMGVGQPEVGNLNQCLG